MTTRIIICFESDNPDVDAVYDETNEFITYATEFPNDWTLNEFETHNSQQYRDQTARHFQETRVMKELLLTLHKELKATNRVIPLELATYAQLDNAAEQIIAGKTITGLVR